MKLFEYKTKYTIYDFNYQVQSIYCGLRMYDSEEQVLIEHGKLFKTPHYYINELDKLKIKYDIYYANQPIHDYTSYCGDSIFQVVPYCSFSFIVNSLLDELIVTSEPDKFQRIISIRSSYQNNGCAYYFLKNYNQFTREQIQQLNLLFKPTIPHKPEGCFYYITFADNSVIVLDNKDPFLLKPDMDSVFKTAENSIAYQFYKFLYISKFSSKDVLSTFNNFLKLIYC